MSKKIKIVTDSTSDISPKIAKKLNIDVVPLNIFFGEEKFKDGVSISASEVYQRLQNKKGPWPTTSQPAARDLLPYYNKAFEEGYETIISVHVTSNMSGTLNSVNLAKQMVQDKDLVIVDSNTVTHSLGLIVYELAKHVEAGKSKDKLLNILNNTLIPNAQICAVVDTLEYLHKGGRIGRAQKVLGTLLNMKPILQVKDGFVDSFGKVKGFDEAFDNYVKMVPKVFDNLLTDTVWIGYAADDENAKRLYEAIKDLPNAPKEIDIYEIGPTVGVHLGPKSMTMSWIGNWDTDWFFGKY
ncbi:MAG: DegV family protein [Asgard group archaeon]|nr:DegV family protein [Asgard group archaeon]